MKRIIIFLVSASLFYSCSSLEKQIIGQWIEKNNFYAPQILEFNEDYYTMPYNQNRVITFPLYRQVQYLYKLRGDTLLEVPYFDDIISRRKISLNDDELIIPSQLNDSFFVCYERNKYKNYLDFINTKLDLSINLPSGRFYALNWAYTSNTFYVDLDDSNNIMYLLNGEPISIDSTLYIKLKSEDYRSEIICFADEKLKVKDLNPIKVEAYKANYHKIYFGIIDDSSHLGSIPLKTPFVKFSDPDTSRPILPKLIEDVSFFKDRYFILCEVCNDKFIINGVENSYESFIRMLEDRALEKGGFHLILNYDENLRLQEYVDFAARISISFESIKSAYMKNKFKTSDYWSLSDEEKEIFDKEFFIFFTEILKDDLAELYTYIKK